MECLPIFFFFLLPSISAAASESSPVDQRNSGPTSGRAKSLDYKIITSETDFSSVKRSVFHIFIARQKRFFIAVLQERLYPRYDIHHHSPLSRESGGRGAFRSSLRSHLGLTGGNRPSNKHRAELISHCFSSRFLSGPRLPANGPPVYGVRLCR